MTATRLGATSLRVTLVSKGCGAPGYLLAGHTDTSSASAGELEATPLGRMHLAGLLPSV